jgi:TFIIF-interacting CTD phosphatase-like protein
LSDPFLEKAMKKLLILDLDETLVYSTKELIDCDADFNVHGSYQVWKRPHLNKFLAHSLF